MLLFLDLFLSNLPRLKANGDCPGNLGPFTRVNVSDKNRPLASIKYSPVLESVANILTLATVASLMVALDDYEMALD